MTDDTAVTIWDLLEQDAPKHCDAVQELYSWSLNFDSGTGPFELFLDLIGYSEDQYGEDLYRKGAGLGYIELAHLAAALTAYADHPGDVQDYVARLTVAEAQQ